mgnify:CR=1 FL=1
MLNSWRNTRAPATRRIIYTFCIHSWHYLIRLVLPTIHKWFSLMFKHKDWRIVRHSWCNQICIYTPRAYPNEMIPIRSSFLKKCSRISHLHLILLVETNTIVSRSINVHCLSTLRSWSNTWRLLRPSYNTHFYSLPTRSDSIGTSWYT